MIAVADSLLIVFIAICTASFGEGLTYLLVYRSEKYKRLKNEIERKTKRLEKKKDQLNEIDRGNKRRIERQEERLKLTSRDLSMFKMKSMFAIGFAFTALLSTFNSIFEGRVVAKLPFVPISYIQGLSHRSLVGEDYSDCSFIFLYILCTMSIRQGRAAKRARATQELKETAENENSTTPHSFVFHRGSVGRYVKRLVTDLRMVMQPYTAPNLKARKKNSLRDFVTVAGPLGVNHFVVLTRSETALNLRVIRLPQGPTLTFRVEAYSLAKDIVSAQKRPVSYEKQFLHGPLVVMNNFQAASDQHHLKLTQSMFQNMFPSLSINTVDLNDIRRCVLWNYNSDSDTIDFRHYTIKPVPTGVSKSTKKLIKPKLPDLGKYKDISEYFENPGQLSESEYELEAGTNEVELPQDLTARGCRGKKTLAAVRLVELGPRLSLKLLKIESGVDDGEVLYHSFHSKTPEEVAALESKIKKDKKSKMSRRKAQELNVQKKKSLLEIHKQKCLIGSRIKHNLTSQEPKQNPEAGQEQAPKRLSRSEARKLKMGTPKFQTRAGQKRKLPPPKHGKRGKDVVMKRMKSSIKH